MVHDWKSKITEKKSESYTKIPYISNLDDLEVWEYYFVIDNLTENSNNINKELYNQIFTFWKTMYESWNDKHNHIIVLKVSIKD